MTAIPEPIEANHRDRLAAAAEVLALVARLHDREPDRAFIDGLTRHAVIEWLDEQVETPGAKTALLHLREAAAAILSQTDTIVLDDLAAEFADIYLTYAYRVSPTGSVWLTEDGLERQEPMFAVRGWYQHYSIEVADWRIRPDDHIVHELLFVAHLCELRTATAAIDAARFLDQNLLRWLPEFSRRIGERCRQKFFTSTAEFTAAYIEELRDLLAAITGIARPPVIEEATDGPAPGGDADIGLKYVPGLAESW